MTVFCCSNTDVSSVQLDLEISDRAMDALMSLSRQTGRSPEILAVELLMLQLGA
jgi:hypothetical protein